jgi:hypothetical protein
MNKRVGYQIIFYLALIFLFLTNFFLLISFGELAFLVGFFGIFFFLSLVFVGFYFRIQKNIDNRFIEIITHEKGEEKGPGLGIDKEDLKKFNLERAITKKDITVVVAIRDRDEKNLINSFESIRKQDYSQDLIKIKLIDYDSKKDFSRKYQKICVNFNAEYIKIENKPFWSKSHALNIGIRRVRTKYVLSTDSDIVFEKNYVSESIRALEKDPFQVVLFPCLNLPEKVGKNMSFNQLKKAATPRFKSGYVTPGINLALSYFYDKIRGYDENYLLWGGLDDDIIKRFRLLGLRVFNIKDNSSYLHQWHSLQKKNKKYESIRIKNERYYRLNDSIFRNRYGWGDLDQ